MSGAIASYWQQMGADRVDAPGQSLWIRIEDDHLTLSLDSSGNFLYQRGLKTHPGRAPIRETLAAAILMAAGFRADRPLIDPMCGSGTFALEGALLAKQVPPGLMREFAFMDWPAFRPRQWQYFKSQAVDAIKTCSQPMILASDIDGTACQALAGCIAANGLQDAVRVRPADFFQLAPDQIIGEFGPGLVVLNPPYGRRLHPAEGLEHLYRTIGSKLADSFKQWRVAVLVPRPELIANLPAGLTSRSLTHGGQTLTLVTGTIG
jgi:putative N6-adenine-specific DNA methylase